jgi:hypothetical protein
MQLLSRAGPAFAIASMSLDEIAPGLWRFTVTRNGIPPTMTAYALRDGDETILVDPLVAGETSCCLSRSTRSCAGACASSSPPRSTCAAPSFCGGAGATGTRSPVFGHEHCATRLEGPLRVPATPRRRDARRRRARTPVAITPQRVAAASRLLLVQVDPSRRIRCWRSSNNSSTC